MAMLSCDGDSRRRMAQGVFAILLPSCLAGCGYSSDSLYPRSIRTVYVEMFQSREFRRGIEMQLTEALRKEIDQNTPYRNAPREKADTLLTGEVLEWREATLGRDPVTHQPRQTAGPLAIRYRWKDQRTGKILVDKPRFVATPPPYVRPLGETVHHAREDATAEIARSVRRTMETGW